MSPQRSLVIRTTSTAETRAVGVALGRSLSTAATVSLTGPLGSGKTMLAQGICEGLGVTEPVTSPTFTLENEYTGNRGRRVIHLDCFRLQNPAEFEDLAVEDRLTEDTVQIVEWGERAGAALEPGAIQIVIEVGDADERRISIRVPPGIELPLVPGAS